MAARTKRKAIVQAALAGAALAAMLGAALVGIPQGDRLLGLGFGGTLARLSYDVPFAFRSGRSGVPEELVVVYVDSRVKANLQQPKDQPLDRKYYALLLKTLKRDGARLVLFDFIFDEPGKDPLADQEFADAIKEHGRVVLVADFVKEPQGNIATEVPVPPIEPLAKAAAGWGLARLTPDADDRVLRRLDPGAELYPSAGWVAAGLLNARVTRDERQRGQVRWLNYYGPPVGFRSVNLDQALQPDGLSPGFFRDKLVVVGSRPEPQLAPNGNDQFSTPFSRSWNRVSSGAGIHALTLLNLVRGDWLTEMSISWQLILVIAWGAVVGAGLTLVRPWHAAGLALFGCLLVGAAAIYVQLFQNIWWPWLIPVAVQTPVALVWSVGWQYALESRRRDRLRRAFAGYLSPHLADRIANENFDLSLGGKIVEATIMFTDLEGFTAMSENLNPKEVSLLLTTYFNTTTRAILEQDGTIIKYMGDAVLAVWGAPLPDPKHAERAVIAAWGMVRAGRTEIAGRSLRTRVGINTGPALAGNLGSDYRFDYAVVGDTTNTASRLETLNKVLGTEILISEATRSQIDCELRTRPLGRFLMAGKVQPVAIHEVLGVGADVTMDCPWLPVFEQALGAFVAGKLDDAQQLFQRVSTLRQGGDGPSEFYLKQIAAAREANRAEQLWDGIIVFTSK